MTQSEEFEAWFKRDFHPDKSGPYLKNMLLEAWERATKAHAVPQWISVEDQLPKHDAGKWSDPVIALSDIGLVFRLSYCGGWQRNGDFMSTGSSKVTHWIPMPKFTEDENVS